MTKKSLHSIGTLSAAPIKRIVWIGNGSLRQLNSSANLFEDEISTAGYPIRTKAVFL